MKAKKGRDKMVPEKRKELRYKIMTILYQVNLYKNNNINYNIENIIKEHVTEDSKFVTSLVLGVIKTEDRLEDIANKYLEDWDIKRLGYTDQAILKMAIYELLYMDTPDLICIDEAINLAKQYSDLKVAKMINGVLDKIYHDKVKDGK